MDLDPQPSSSSTSSFLNVEKFDLNNLAEMNTEEPLPSDKIKEEKNVKSDSQSESENQDECFIDKIPPEMLMEILKYLDVKSLTASRLVSRKWNKMVQEIIKSRDDVETKFFCTIADDGTFKIKGKTERASLGNYIKCFEDSNESPLYTRFCFCFKDSSVFDHADWIQFISEFGENVKSLRLAINEFENFDAQLIRFVGNLRNLLSNQLPNLQALALQLPYFGRNPAFPNIRLFPPGIFHLPHLKVLHLDEFLFSHYTGVVTDLLRASVNLQKIESIDRACPREGTETFRLLQSLGKLDCLQTAEFSLDAKFFSEFEENFSVSSVFKLKKLNLDISPIYKTNKAFWPEAAVFLSSIFESSKDTLKELTVDQMGFLPQFKLPKFSKLTNLIIYERHEEELQVFPPGINLMEIFPVLQCLELLVPWTDFFPHYEDPSCLSNLKILKITGDGMTKVDVARISLVCPKLKELVIDGSAYKKGFKNFPEVGKGIWTHLTKLESLELKIDMVSRANTFPAVDSCFTGFSREDCTRLFEELMENEESDEKQESLMKSESGLDAQRINPSILDLKDLKNLTVGIREDRKTPELSRNFLKVSEKYAFQLMKNLNYKIDKNFYFLNFC